LFRHGGVPKSKTAKPEMTICTRSVALTKLKRGRRGLNTFPGKGKKGRGKQDPEGKRCRDFSPYKKSFCVLDMKRSFFGMSEIHYDIPDEIFSFTHSREPSLLPRTFLVLQREDFVQ
jgi:hypothetical protein